MHRILSRNYLAVLVVISILSYTSKSASIQPPDPDCLFLKADERVGNPFLLNIPLVDKVVS